MIVIRPHVGMYAAFPRLNYKPWFAMAEFVDNAIQSYLSNREALEQVEGPEFVLEIDITIEEGRIQIRDNAAGIHPTDYARAFVPALPPPDTSGLSEFGIGMKAAACWFSKKWRVRTTSLGQPLERAIEFDIPRIVSEGVEELPFEETAAEPGDHYTSISMVELNVQPRGRTVGKMKSHLASIYRQFLRDGTVKIRFNGDDLAFNTPEILQSPYYREPKGQPVRWEKKLELDLGEGHRIWGWAALRAKGSVSSAGFAILRRGRLIQGCGDADTYRPESIFRQSNSYTYQRLFGEIHVAGFAVTHTKDGVQWHGWEEEILEWLKAELDADPLPLLQHAEGFRARVKKKDINTKHLASALSNTTAALEQGLRPVIESQINASPDSSDLPETLQQREPLGQSRFVLSGRIEDREWTITIEIVHEPSIEDWYELSFRREEVGESEAAVTIRLNLAHPFMIRRPIRSRDDIAPLLDLTAALAIAEITARESNVKQAGTIRRNLNEILRRALSVAKEEVAE